MSIPATYLPTVRRVPNILDAIQRAGVPDKFTHEFLKQLGFTSSADRSVIGVLKALRFLDDSGVPTDRYKRFRDPAHSKIVLASALKDAYADIFTIDQSAHARSRADLKGMFQRASGKSERVAELMADTFGALAKQADFTSPPIPISASETSTSREDPDAEEIPEALPLAGSIRLHHDVHIHLPDTTDIAVYNAIFKSLRENLLP